MKARLQISLRQRSESLTTVGKIESIELVLRCFVSDGSSISTTVTVPLLDADSGDDGLIKWYLESYVVHDPFDRSRADIASSLLEKYAKTAALEIWSSGMIGSGADIELEINYGRNNDASEFSDSDGQKFRAIHWELLEDTSFWPVEGEVKSVVVYRCMDSQRTTHTLPTLPDRINILLIISRPGRKGDVSVDVNYQLVSKTLVSLSADFNCKNTNRRIGLKVLRPPTFAALQDHLCELEPGHYSAVHFDMHGEFLDSDQGKKAALLFCRIARGKGGIVRVVKDPVPAASVAKVLSKAGIRSAVVNACESASTGTTTLDSNLAEVFVRSGIEQVLGMSYRISEEAVEVFMGAFYHSLFTNELDFVTASQEGRKALRQNRKRRARYMTTLDLSDYFVPTLYSKVASRTTRQITPLSSYLSSTLSDASSIYGSGHGKLLGRDLDILRLEMSLWLERLIILHGQGGCGKTALIQYCANWWRESGFIRRHCIYDIQRVRPKKMALKDILETLKDELDLDEEISSEEEIIGEIQRGNYLIVFDSAECLNSKAPLDLVGFAPGAEEDINRFLQQASRGNSYIVLCSRKPSTPIATFVSDTQCYCLSGLPINDAVEFALGLTCNGESGVPDSFRAREELDWLRRIIILLEGNPDAIKLVFSTFEPTSPSAIFNALLFGRVSLDLDTRNESRMCRTIRGTTFAHDLSTRDDAIPLSPTMLGSFWTVMPQDLTEFYWFLILPSMSRFQEGSYLAWFSADIRKYMKQAFELHSARVNMEKMLSTLEDIGVLSPAEIHLEDGRSLDSYHIHPIFTLETRNSEAYTALEKRLKPIHVRSFLLWGRKEAIDLVDRTRIFWENAFQSPDHLLNMLAVPMAYSLEEDKLAEEVKTHGMSLFDLIARDSVRLYFDTRQANILTPLFEAHLARYNLYVCQKTLSGGELQETDVGSILDLTHRVMKARHGNYSSNDLVLIRSALLTWGAFRGVNRERTIRPDTDLSLFQLRHWEGLVVLQCDSNGAAIAIFERNLREDPQQTTAFEGACRRVLYQDLQYWTMCLNEIYIAEGKVDMKLVSEMVTDMTEKFRPGRFLQSIMKYCTEEPELANSMSLEMLNPLVMEGKRDVIEGFGNLAKKAFFEPIIQNYADLAEEFGVKGDQPDMMAFLSSPGVLQSYDTPGWSSSQQTFSAVSEVSYRTMAGDIKGGKAALDKVLQRESMPSSNTGWRSLRALHMLMYEAYIRNHTPPDFKNALVHLDHVRNAHRGVGITNRELLAEHMIYASCYDGLEDFEKAGREFLSASQIIPVILATEFEENGLDMAETISCDATLLPNLRKLDWSIKGLKNPALGGLRMTERAKLRKIFVEAEELTRQREQVDWRLAKLKEDMEFLKIALKKFDGVEPRAQPGTKSG